MTAKVVCFCGFEFEIIDSIELKCVLLWIKRYFDDNQANTNIIIYEQTSGAMSNTVKCLSLNCLANLQCNSLYKKFINALCCNNG